MSTPVEDRLKDQGQAEILVGLFFDHTVAQPVNSVLDAEILLAQIDRGIDERVTERLVLEHLRPYIDREKARAAVRKDSVGDWFSAELQAELRALAMRPVRLDRKFLRTAVQQDAVKHMVRSIVEETLNRFVSTLKPGGSGGGLIGSVGRGAFGIASRAGKGILGQLGSQFENQLQSAVSSFVQNSTSMMLDRRIVILTNPETAQHLGRSGAAAYDAVMKQSTADVWSFAERVMPIDDLLECLPGQLLHLMGRDDIREGIREEVAAVLAVEGEKSISELFVDDGHLDAMRSEVIQVGAPLLTGFAGTEVFAAWLAEG